MEIFTDVLFEKKQDLQIRGRAMLLAFSMWCDSVNGNSSKFESEFCRNCAFFKDRGPVSCTGVDGNFKGTLKLPKDTRLPDLENKVARAACAMAIGIRRYLENGKIIDIVRGNSF